MFLPFIPLFSISCHLFLHFFFSVCLLAFTMYDRDRSNTLEPHELQPALQAAGFSYITEFAVRPFIKKVLCVCV
jgi:hypothetical protein